jgi:guanylate kinase
VERKRAGLLLIISAPSGTGKSTLIRRLCVEFPRLAFSISYTTRSPRSGEVQGREYHFVSKKDFISLREQGLLAEWAEVHDQYYGTSRPAVLDMLAKGRDVLFDIDVQGARQLRKTFPQGALVFLLPPSRQILEARLRGRGTEDLEALSRRLNNARREIEQADFFDFLIINDDLEQAYLELRAVYLAEGLRLRCNALLSKAILETWDNDG